MLTLALTLLFLGLVTDALALSPQELLARKDRESHYPETDWRYLAYVMLFPNVGKDSEELERAGRLAIASDSVQPILERCQPVHIGGGVFRLDLRDLHWRVEDWELIAYKRNPYYLPGDIVVRLDWLLVEMSDMDESDTYFRFIFGGNNIPKKRDDVLKFFKVENDPFLNYGLIEGKSGVSKQGTRRIESRPTQSGYRMWRTEDVLELTNERDAIEHPGGGSPFDAEEGIVRIPKLSIGTGARGVLQWYYLANGKGDIINKADPGIVEDFTRFRHHPDILNPGACIQCHAEGMKHPTLNLFRELLEKKVEVFANQENKETLEAFHLADLTKELDRENDDFQTMVELACGAKSEVVAANFKSAVYRYDAPLNLQETATELGVTVPEWVKALAVNGTLPARLASLAHQGTVPRAAWEQDFVKAYYATHGGEPIKQPPAVVPKPKPKDKPQPQQQQGYRRKAA